MGWSTGGVAMQFAANNPERVRKLVLMAPASTRGYPIDEKDKHGDPTDEPLTTREEIAADPGGASRHAVEIQPTDRRFRGPKNG